MTGDRHDLLRRQHARLAAEHGLRLLVVEPRIAPGDEQQVAIPDPERQGLGDLRRLDAMARRRERHRGGAAVELDNGDVGGADRQEGTDQIPNSFS